MDEENDIASTHVVCLLSFCGAGEGVDDAIPDTKNEFE
jgi:hypothetical protein